MKYVMMGGGLRDELGGVGAAEQERRVRCHQQALNDLLRARVIAGRTGLIFVSVGLGPFHGGEGRTLSVGNRGGKRFRTDGPFPETREVVGGFDIIDFASREEAIEFAKVKKNVHATHIEEIRPIGEFWWISHSPRLTETNIFMLSSVEDGRAASDHSPEERKRIIRQHQAVGAEYVTQRGMVDGKPGLWVGVRLSPPAEAVTIRRNTGVPRLVDGPFAETRELLGGFNLIACDSFEEAIGWAEKLTPRDGDTIEVRLADGFWWVYHE
jgi:hypothetical protein